MAMGLGELQELVMDRHSAVHVVTKSQTRQSHRTELTSPTHSLTIFLIWKTSKIYFKFGFKIILQQ